MKSLKNLLWIQLFLLTVLGAASLLVKFSPPADENMAAVEETTQFRTVSSR